MTRIVIVSVDETLGVDNFEVFRHIYPNPVSSKFKFISISGLTSANNWLTVTDSNGKVIFRKMLNNSFEDTTVYISFLHKGLYNFILDNGKYHKTQKILVN